MTDEAPIRDAPEESRFVVEVDGHLAELEYRTNGQRFIIVHTEVPPELEGHGLAGRLVRAALDKAIANQFTVVPWCPYARSWLRNHPDEAAKVEIDWTPPPKA